MVFANIVMMLATMVIAYYAYANHCLSKEMNRSAKQRQDEIRESTEQHQQEIKDLYQAIVVSTLISGPSSTGRLERAIKAFEKHYKGKTKIFG